MSVSSDELTKMLNRNIAPGLQYPLPIGLNPVTAYHRLSYSLDQFLRFIEREHRSRWWTIEPMTPRVPRRTMTIEIIWGDVPPDAMTYSNGFNYLEAQYVAQHKDNMRRTGVVPRKYAWPTWKQLCRKGDSAGMVSVSSRSRWVIGVDKKAMIEGRTTEHIFQMWRNAYMGSDVVQVMGDVKTAA